MLRLLCYCCCLFISTFHLLSFFTHTINTGFKRKHSTETSLACLYYQIAFSIRQQAVLSKHFEHEQLAIINPSIQWRFHSHCQPSWIDHYTGNILANSVIPTSDVCMSRLDPIFNQNKIVILHSLTAIFIFDFGNIYNVSDYFALGDFRRKTFTNYSCSSVQVPMKSGRDWNWSESYEMDQLVYRIESDVVISINNRQSVEKKERDEAIQMKSKLRPNIFAYSKAFTFFDARTIYCVCISCFQQNKLYL